MCRDMWYFYHIYIPRNNIRMRPMPEMPIDPKEFVDQQAMDTSPADGAPMKAASVASPPRQLGDHSRPTDPMTYVGFDFDPAMTGGPDDGAQEFDPFPLPADPQHEYDHGISPGFWYPRDRDEHVPGLDRHIDAAAARTELKKLFPVKIPPLGVSADRPVPGTGLLAQGGLQPNDDPVTAPLDPKEFADAPPPGPITGGNAGDGMLQGGSAKDMLAATPQAEPQAGPGRRAGDGKNPAPFINYPEVRAEQKDQLRLITVHMPKIAEALEDPERRARILADLDNWEKLARWEIHLRTRTAGHVKLFFNGGIIDPAAGMVGGAGKIVGMLSALHRDAFTRKLAQDIGQDKAEQVTDRVLEKMAGDPDDRMKLGEYVSQVHANGPSGGELAARFEDAAEFIKGLAFDVGVKEEHMPPDMLLARAMGTAAATVGMSYLGASRFATGGGIALMALDEADQLISEAGLKPDDPGARAIYTIAVVSNVALNFLPLGKLTNPRVVKGLGGREITDIGQLLNIMPPHVQKRFLGTMMEMAEGATATAITGFLERTINEITAWHVAADDAPFKAKHNNDMWRYVFRNEAQDIKLDMAIGAMLPAYGRMLGLVSKRRKQAAIRAKFNLGEEFELHVDGFTPGFITRAAETLNRSVPLMFRQLELALPPEMIHLDIRMNASRRGEIVPDISALRAAGLDQYNRMSTDEALQLDDRAADTRYYQGMVSGTDERNLHDSLDKSSDTLPNKYAKAIKYGHAVEFARQFRSDQELLKQLGDDHVYLSLKLDTIREYFHIIRVDGGIGVGEHNDFAATLREKLAAIRDGHASDLDLPKLVRDSGNEAVIRLFEQAHKQVTNWPKHAVRRSFAALHSVNPNVSAPDLWTEARADITKLNARDLTGTHIFRIPVGDGKARLSEQRLRTLTIAHMKRFLVQERLDTRRKHNSRLKKFFDKDPIRAQKLGDAIRAFRAIRRLEYHRPLSFTEEGTMYAFAQDFMDDEVGRFPPHQVAKELQLAVAGPGVFASAKRFRSENPGPENTLHGAVNRIGRAVMGRLKYGVGISSDIYMQAENFALRYDDGKMAARLGPVFDFLHTLHTPGQDRDPLFIARGVAAVKILTGLLSAEGKAPSGDGMPTPNVPEAMIFAEEIPDIGAQGSHRNFEDWMSALSPKQFDRYTRDRGAREKMRKLWLGLPRNRLRGVERQDPFTATRD